MGRVCNNCGKENIESAAFCERCGNRLPPIQAGQAPKKGKDKATVIIVIASVCLLLFVFVLIGTVGMLSSNYQNNTSTTKSYTAPDGLLDLSAEQIIKELDANIYRAQEEFEGREIYITGVVGSIEESYTSGFECYVSLRSLSRSIDLTHYLTMYFSSKNDILDLSKGDVVKIKGVVSEVSDGWLGVSFDMKYCEVVGIR